MMTMASSRNMLLRLKVSGATYRMRPAYRMPAAPPYTLASMNAVIRSSGISAPMAPAARASSLMARSLRPSRVRTTKVPNARASPKTTISR